MNSIVTMGMFGGNGPGGGGTTQVVEKIVYVDRIVNSGSSGGGHVVLGGGTNVIKVPKIKMKKIVIDDEEKRVSLTIKSVEEI